jgi:ATP-dependent NAD(P)H-hydrate dehydratase
MRRTQDGLYLVTQRPELVRGYPLATLTPNKVEFERLCSKLVSEWPGRAVPNTVG